jgi:hypothetical protein
MQSDAKPTVTACGILGWHGVSFASVKSMKLVYKETADIKVQNSG